MVKAYMTLRRRIQERVFLPLPSRRRMDVPEPVSPNLTALTGPHESPFWGVLISICMFGITIVQGWIYLHTNNDKWPLRLLVTTLVFLDLSTTILVALMAHYYYLEHYGEPLVLLTIPLFVGVESFLTTIVAFLVQLFFASRVYLLGTVNRINISASIVIVSTALAAFVSGLLMSYDVSRIQSVVVFTLPRMEVEVTCFTGLTALADIITTFMLSWTVLSSRSSVKSITTVSISRVLRKLLIFMVTRGFLVSVVQTMTLILYIIFPDQLYWSAFHYFLSRVYVITMVSMLNARKSLQETLSALPMTDHDLVAHPTIESLNYYGGHIRCHVHTDVVSSVEMSLYKEPIKDVGSV